VATFEKAPTRSLTIWDWDPFREFEALRERMDEDLGRRLGSSQVVDAEFTPLADIEETDDAWVIEVELPGVDKHDLDVQLLGRRITITGERKEKARNGVLRRKTRVTGSFRYEVTLPDDVDSDKIDAKLVDGELTVRVPKTAPEQSRRIPITS